ncbi:MAG: hypothetical protein IPK83_21325 [Planctomycetes bacterium]|nr:hypothetical protein [Planctomycetota bacterium]
MELTDAQLAYFVDNRLKLPKGKRSEYLAQVDRLIANFSAAAKDDDLIGVKKFLKTGSLRKGTVLRPAGNFGVDADVAVFLNSAGATKYDLSRLHERIRRLLAKAYPNKNSEDFTVQPRTLGIVFRDSGLEMDLVPLIPIEGDGDFGWQPSSQGDPPVKTSVTKQLDFIRSRKEAYPRFTALVRLLKYWRNFHDLDDCLRSFTIELLVCHLQDTQGALSLSKTDCCDSSSMSTRPNCAIALPSRSAEHRVPGRRTASSFLTRATPKTTWGASSPTPIATRL